MTTITAHWSANPAVLAGCFAVAAVHLTGLRLLRSGGGRPAGSAAREALVCYAGLLAVLAALVSPAGYWAVRYIWVRTVQDLLLAVVAPPLIVLGAPWLALRRGARATGRQFTRWAPGALWTRATGTPGRWAIGASGTWATGAPGTSAGGPSGRRWWLSRPVLAAVAFNVIWCGWHLPVLFDLALSSRVGYAAEVITYLAAGIAFWLGLIGSAPLSPRLSPLRRMTLVCGTIIVGTVLGMSLVFGSSLLYTAYPGSVHHVLSVVADQQVGGAVLWMGILPPFLIVAVALLLNWLNAEEDEALTAGLDRLLSPSGGITAQRAQLRKYTWPSGRALK